MYFRRLSQVRPYETINNAPSYLMEADAHIVCPLPDSIIFMVGGSLQLRATIRWRNLSYLSDEK